MPPSRRAPDDLCDYLEALSRPVFQAGMSWRVIDAKWNGIRQAFAGFEPRAVAEFGEDDVERLLADPRVIRSRAKIEATIDNAQAVLELDDEYGGFRRYLRAHAGYDETVADLKRQFRYIGDSGAYHFLYAVDEPVPAHDEHGDAAGSAQRQSDGHHRTAERLAVAGLDGAAVGGDHGAHDRQSETCSR
ncbi:MAG TPA: DNA-3-methyladenine glycosylase I [Kribbellaceae bacterium]|jgi:DNA-3-methyladenine glycosylase I